MSTTDATDSAPNTEAWIEETVLDRLAYSSNGLSEQVLCAAVIHRAPDEIGTVWAADVKKALTRLSASGRLVKTARRYRRRH